MATNQFLRICFSLLLFFVNSKISAVCGLTSVDEDYLINIVDLNWSRIFIEDLIIITISFREIYQFNSLKNINSLKSITRFILYHTQANTAS